ncbi:MAG: ABC transporter ATP-binding protein [Clostridiales bacterium]|nr:ABC transporter ATP-binding protein [Clostridiales bacterium]
MIKMNGVIKRYGNLVALNQFDLNVEDGQIYGLLGPNGSGKSTAINSMLALLSIEKGEIKLFGQRITPTSYAIKRNIGLVPQEVAVLEDLNVQENVDYFCGLYVSDYRERKRLVDAAIAFTDLDKFRKFLPKKLSGGLKRRLNIACGIAHKPSLLILDEPTVAVDPQSRNAILEGIKALNQQGTTVLYTSHYMEEVEQICTTITIMDKGKGLLTGTKEELKASVNLGDQVDIRLINHKAEDMDTIRSLPYVVKAELVEDHLKLEMARGESRLASLFHVLERQGIGMAEMSVRQPTLNDVFLEVTGKELRDHV